jgi:hypothetical protein
MITIAFVGCSKTKAANHPNGKDKRAIGELTPKLVKKNGKPRIAKLHDDGFWYWTF